MALVFVLARTAHAGWLSFFSPAVSNAQASGQTTSASGSSQTSQTMPILEASSLNQPSPAGSSQAVLPPIDGEVLSPDLAAATQSGIDTLNIQKSTYVVQPDDTLTIIASMFDISVDTVKQANGLTGNSIHSGQTLVILPVTGVLYTVGSGDTLSGIAKKLNADAADILAYNELSASSTLTKGRQLIIPHGKPPVTEVRTYLAHQKVPSFEPLLDPVWNWPVAPAGYYACPIPGARLSQGLHGHNAVDLAIAYGTPIHAAAAGTVIVAKSNGLWNGGYGNFVIISHGNGSQTLYAHMSRVAVSPGAQVSRSQTIGYIGMTGMTTGPHTHFEIRGAQNPFVDPALCQ